MYSSDSSIPMLFLPSDVATAKVVPEPAKGSSTTPASEVPARMHGRTRASGNVAK